MSSILTRDTAAKAATLATILFAVAIVLQLLIAVGVVPITAAWGGRQAVLTPTLRLASVAAAVVLALFAYVIRARAGLMGQTAVSTFIRISAWIITVFLALNTLGNFASISSFEKFVLGPITLVLTVCCLIVAASKVD
jgi:hypothetical protein